MAIAAAGLLFTMIPGARRGLAQEQREAFCDRELRTDCIPDSIEIEFDDNRYSVIDLPAFEEGLVVDATVVFLTLSAQLQGWSYAVSHDPSVLEIVPGSLTVDGTDAGATINDGFNVAIPVGSKDRDGEDPSGFISAVVLSFVERVHLPSPRRNSVARVSYRVIGEPGPDGTSVRIEDNKLFNRPSPPMAINLTAGGTAYLPETLVHGVMRLAPEEPEPFMRGDPDGNCGINISDAIVIAGVLFGFADQPFDCNDILDADDDGITAIPDIVAVLEWTFGRGPPLPPPCFPVAEWIRRARTS
jgi:hypothetical protein